MDSLFEKEIEKDIENFLTEMRLKYGATGFISKSIESKEQEIFGNEVTDLWMRTVWDIHLDKDIAKVVYKNQDGKLVN